MTPEQILNKARRLTYSTIQQYNNTDGLQDLNEIYQDVITTIINEVNENYFYDIYTTDTAINQSEYVFEYPTSTTAGMNKVKELYIKYTSTGDFKKARYVEESTMEMTPDWYEINQSPESPIFRIADNSVFIYPKPSEAVTGGLKASVTIIPKDLLITDTEDKIKIQRQHHNILVFGILPYIYQSKGMLNEKNDSLSTYERLKDDLVRKLSDRDLSPLETSLPDLSYYE